MIDEEVRPKHQLFCYTVAADFCFKLTFLFFFSLYHSLTTIQTAINTEAVLEYYLGMTTRVPFVQKHANVQRATLVRGRRILRNRYEWQVHCNDRLVIANVFGEASMCTF